MKNILPKILVFSLIMMAVHSTVSAQESTTLQFMKGLPQSDLQNPALHNDSSTVIIGLPVLSGMYFDFNSGFAINDLIHKGTGSLADSLVLDIDRFHNSLKTTNTVLQNFSIPLFYLGIRSKKSFFSLGISEKEVARYSFDKSFVTFLKDGNAAYMGHNFDLGDMNVDAIHYREFAFGYSNELIKNKLTIGVKAKILYGKSAIQTERMNLQVETATDGSYLNLSSDMKVNLSAPVTVVYDSDGYFSGINADNVEPKDYMLQKGNMGMAFDLGAVYKLTPKITLSGSIIDLGKISFKKDIHSLSHITTYKWDGIDFSNSVGDTTAATYVKPSKLADDEMKKIENAFKPKKSEFGSEAFDVSIPMKIYLGGTYEVNNKLNIGLLDRLYKNGNFSQNTVTLSANAMLGKYFGLTGSYSIIGSSYNNAGLGMVFNMGIMQLYLVSDNLLALADPAKAKFANFGLGMNFHFEKKHVTVVE